MGNYFCTHYHLLWIWNSADGFERLLSFRKNLATLNEDYANNPDGAVMFEQTLVIPIHGRDAAKSRKNKC